MLLHDLNDDLKIVQRVASVLVDTSQPRQMVYIVWGSSSHGYGIPLDRVRLFQTRINLKRDRPAADFTLLTNIPTQIADAALGNSCPVDGSNRQFTTECPQIRLAATDAMEAGRLTVSVFGIVNDLQERINDTDLANDIRKAIDDNVWQDDRDGSLAQSVSATFRDVWFQERDEGGVADFRLALMLVAVCSGAGVDLMVALPGLPEDRHAASSLENGRHAIDLVPIATIGRSTGHSGMARSFTLYPLAQVDRCNDNYMPLTAGKWSLLRSDHPLHEMAMWLLLRSLQVQYCYCEIKYAKSCTNLDPSNFTDCFFLVVCHYRPFISIPAPWVTTEDLASPCQ